MQSVELSGQLWRYRTYGCATTPALVLLHGFTGSHLSWEALASRWAHRYYVITPDLPGHGKTAYGAHPESLTMAATADRLSQLLHHLSITKACVLGYSMGGRLALHFAVQHADQVRCLILESASPGLDDPTERQERRTRDWALAQAIESRGLQWFVPFWANQPLFQNQPEWLKAKENKIRRTQSPTGLAQSLRGAGTGEQASLWPQLPEIQVPVLLITGSQDQKFGVIAQRMAQRIPHARWVLVQESGHTVHGEQAERFYTLVNAFLAEESAS